VLLVVAGGAVAVAGSGGSSPSRTLTPVASTAAPAANQGSSGVREELVANTREANQIVGSTISAKLAQLKGVPVVVNQWASWCTNCRAEFPFFQQLGRQDAGSVAFVGLDSQDSQSAAAAFLRQFPVDYPSVFDPSASQAQSLGGGQGWPTTIFFNAAHQITNLHIGAYPTLQSLEQDIARYT
jgi:thiol-disulfide isomerase/thioredoxin